MDLTGRFLCAVTVPHIRSPRYSVREAVNHLYVCERLLPVAVPFRNSVSKV